jgi:ABC-2 type transport system ATP-binding protein
MAEKEPQAARVAASRGDVAQPAQTLLQVTTLTKRYVDQVALADIAFTVRAGEILGIIGPNGAGKTTLLEALAGVLPTDSADILWRGRPLPPARRRDAIFYIPDGMRPYHDQPVARVLAFFAGVYRRSPAHIAGVVAAVGLAPVLEKRVQALSKGYSRRLMLAVGLLTPQPLLLMDEPFDGFDLKQTRDIVGVLRRCAADGRTLVLAIHQLPDAERVCDRFVLLADGRIRGVGTLDDLRTRTQLPAGSLEEIFLALT